MTKIDFFNAPHLLAQMNQDYTDKHKNNINSAAYLQGLKENKDSDYWFDKAILGDMEVSDDTANLNRYKKCLKRNLDHYPAMYNTA